MKASDIKWLHIEASSKCNAWCPACPRNNNGYGLKAGLVEQDLKTDQLANILDQLPQLEGIQFCGNYGDPVIAHNFVELIKLAKVHTQKIQIHTNGSLRTAAWWKELAGLLVDINHDVWFGIDGLEGVHEIYRQGTDYTKIIENAKAFISAGGTATWQFIPYAHNEHQVKDCIRTSQQLGFKQFKLVKLYRDRRLAKHYRTGEEFDLLPPVEFQHLIRMPKTSTVVDTKNCIHLSPPTMYLAADGKLSTCCFFAPVEKFDSIDELLYNKLDLTHNQCLISCGT